MHSVPVLKYNLGMGMKHYYLVWPCVVCFAQLSVARRQAIRVDCIKVFPISIVELSQGYVNDCGSDCVGGEGYSANVFVRSSLLYLSTVGIVQAFFALEEALALHISCTNFLATHS